MARDRLSFFEDPNHTLKIKCSVGLTIEPYGYRHGQRIATINLDEHNPEMSFKEIVLEIYRLKTNCVTILGNDEHLNDLIEFLQKFINYCKININYVGREVDNIVRFDKVLSTYDKYIDGMDENDTIVLLACDNAELVSAQKEAEDIRRNFKFAGKIYIVTTYNLDTTAYDAMLSTSMHYKTKYQVMF